jgi:hypothetical protein
VATYGTFVDGVALTAAEINDFFVWKSYNSGANVRQNNVGVSPSTQIAKYAVVNKTVYYYLYSVISAGPGAGAITIELPVTAAANSVRVIGSGYVFDASGSDLVRLSVVRTSTTRASLLSNTGTSLSAYFGTNPTFTFAASDVISVLIAYEAA